MCLQTNNLINKQMVLFSRENRVSRTSLFDGLDGLEEGRLKASSSYSHGTSECGDDEALESLQDRVSFLK